jgi:hypothetical protein
MQCEADYCRSKAAEYERRAQEATDESTRRILYWMRDNWMIAAEGLEIKRGKDKPSGLRGSKPRGLYSL